MKWKIAERHYFLNIIGAIILVGGLGSAILIYWTAANDSGEILGYEEGNGSVYAVKPEDSKRYLRDLELYGGKANVLADEFRNWFVGLWHGESLAFTVGCITIFISFGLFYAANHVRAGLESHKNKENNPDRTS